METKEYMTLKAYRSQLERAVQRRLPTLSRKLHSKGQISEKSYAMLNDESKSEADRAAGLVSMFLDTVKQNPDYYNHVVEALRQCGITVLRQLKRERSNTLVVYMVLMIMKLARFIKAIKLGLSGLTATLHDVFITHIL